MKSTGEEKMNNLLTPEESKYLDNFLKLLEFGASLFTKGKLNFSPKSYKKNFLISSFVAIHNYCEAIYVLCKDSRPHAAYVLMRSILEAYINMLYFANTNSNLKLAKYAISDLESNVKDLKNFHNFIRKYPLWKDKHGLTTPATLDYMIKKNEEVIEAIKKGNKFHKTTKMGENLRKRAEGNDKKMRLKERGGWEFNYLVIFKYFSKFTHLTPSGIQEFYKEENGKLYFDIGKSKNIAPVIITAFGFYLASLNYLKRRKILPIKSELAPFNRESTKMKKFLNNLNRGVATK